MACIGYLLATCWALSAILIQHCRPLFGIYWSCLTSVAQTDKVKMDFRKKKTMMNGKFGKGMGLGLLTLAYVRI